MISYISSLRPSLLASPGLHVLRRALGHLGDPLPALGVRHRDELRGLRGHEGATDEVGQRLGGARRQGGEVLGEAAEALHGGSEALNGL